MRINVYGEEMTDACELVSKTVVDDEFGERTFYGVRLYLESSDALHHSDVDDDRSAVTLWVKATRAGVSQPAALKDRLQRLAVLCDAVPTD